MRHIVDEVVLKFGYLLLPEYDVKREHERQAQHHSKEQSRYHKTNRIKYITVHRGEMYFQHSHLVGRVVAEQHLRIGILLAGGLVVRAAVHLASIACGHREVVGYLDAVVDAMCNMLNNTRDRVPFTDWCYTSSPYMAGFQNRTVQGGLFINLLKF